MSENRAAKFFWHLQDIYQELKPCRFAFVVAIKAQSCFWELSKGGKSYARWTLRIPIASPRDFSISGSIEIGMCRPVPQRHLL